MANHIEEYLTAVEACHDCGGWIMKHVEERGDGDIQVNDKHTNQIIYMRRITLAEAQQLITECTDEERPPIVLLPITSKLVRAIKKAKKDGDNSPISQ